MSKKFTTKEALKLIDLHQQNQHTLRELQDLAKQQRINISSAVQDLLSFELQTILKNIPIDEINRNKEGINIKALQNANLHTLTDIAAKTTTGITRIHGISRSTAEKIRKNADEIIQQAKKDLRLSISTDHKNRKSSHLILTVSSYRKVMPAIKNYEQLFSKYSRQISYAIEELTPGTKTIQWIFTSGSNKQKSRDAFTWLTVLLHGDYGKQLQEFLQEVQAAKQPSSGQAWKDFEKNSIEFLNILEEIVPGVFGTDSSIYGLPESLVHKIQNESPCLDGLSCTLRRYQEWGVKYILHQERVLLGDEMGLGKTIQAIATMVALQNTGATHFLVVCPASVIINWCREITSKSTLTAIKIHGSKKESALNSWLESGGVAVTNYESTDQIKLASSFNFDLMIVDEAHYVKNVTAQRTRNVKNISDHTKRLLFMTGTALENHIKEMKSLIAMLQPKIAEQVKDIEYLSAAPQFQKKIAPVYYHRKRDDVLSELPEMIKNNEWCTLTSAEEKEEYQNAVLTKDYNATRRVSWNVGDLSTSAKASRLLEILEEAQSEGRKIIIFSFFLDTIKKLTHFLGDRALTPITGALSPDKRQAILDEFTKASAGTVLISQIVAGGTGLNIQTASVVILCEPQLKPSTEMQAISRAYRMGQTRNVLVYRLLCENTIDEKITSLLKKKQASFDNFADKAVAAKIELKDNEFTNLIQEEIDRINAEKNTQKH